VVNPYATRADVPGFMKTVDAMREVDSSLDITQSVHTDDKDYKQVIYNYIIEA